MSEDIEQKAALVVQEARIIRIVDPESYVTAGEVWKRLGVVEKEAHEKFDPVVKSTDKAHKDAVALRKKVIEPIENFKNIIKSAMSKYDEEQERIRVAEQARLQKMADEAEAARRATELKSLEEARKLEEARLLEEARKAEAEGNKAKAEAILEVGVKQVEELKAEEKAVAQEPVVQTTVILQKEVPKVQGLSFREVWDAEVVCFSDLVVAVANGTASLSFLKADTMALRQQAQSLKGTMNIPGVKAVSRRV
jgi:uncharacterized membrane protein YqiK